MLLCPSWTHCIKITIQCDNKKIITIILFNWLKFYEIYTFILLRVNRITSPKIPLSTESLIHDTIIITKKQTIYNIFCMQ